MGRAWRSPRRPHMSSGPHPPHAIWKHATLWDTRPASPQPSGYPTCRQVDPYLPAGRRPKKFHIGLKNPAEAFIFDLSTLRRSPAAHTHPMCYRNTLATMWPCDHCTRYTPYLPAGSQKDTSGQASPQHTPIRLRLHLLTSSQADAAAGRAATSGASLS